MRIKTMVGALIGAMAMLVVARPAAAQGSVDFAIGYQFLRFIEEGGENVPKGWGASIAGGPNDMFKVVAEIGGAYKDGGKFHTFQGGLEIAGTQPKATPFVRVLLGMGRFSGGGESDSVFAITPEVGVKVMGSGRVGGRFAVAFPFFRDEGETFKSFRLFLGIVVSSK